MEIIIPAQGNILKILGRPKPAENGCRLMTYVLAKQVDAGWLLFHVLTRELLLLTDAEYAALYDRPELYEKWFLVPMDTDDMKCADKVRIIRRTVQKKPEHITGYTIFTTTDCNARCFYCYEMGRSRIPMSGETAHKTADYIARHCGGEKVHLRWFGGEPLFNKQVIDIICGDLTDRGIEYRSAMTSNGYLFDDETVKQAAGLWKLKRVQITLDGTEAVYNKSKAYIYQDGKSPYQVVLANIRRLLDAGIAVVVRMNIDRHNADDLLTLADELHTRFPENRRLSVYSHVLFEFSGQREKIRAAEERKALYLKQMQLQDKLEQAHMLAVGRLSGTLPVTACMADSGSSRIILPGGEIGLCEHHSEDCFIGHIENEDIDSDIVRQFRTYREKQAGCSACVSYPECVRLEKCLETQQCFPEIQGEKRRKLLFSMQRTYEHWLKKTEPEEDLTPEVC